MNDIIIKLYMLLNSEYRHRIDSAPLSVFICQIKGILDHKFLRQRSSWLFSKHKKSAHYNTALYFWIITIVKLDDPI